MMNYFRNTEEFHIDFMVGNAPLNPTFRLVLAKPTCLCVNNVMWS